MERQRRSSSRRRRHAGLHNGGSKGWVSLRSFGGDGSGEGGRSDATGVAPLSSVLGIGGGGGFLPWRGWEGGLETGASVAEPDSTADGTMSGDGGGDDDVRSTTTTKSLQLVQRGKFPKKSRLLLGY